MYGTVESVEWLTPSLRRIILGGEGLAGWVDVPHADAYVNVAFRPRGAAYGEVFDPVEVRDAYAREEQPARRRYTVRRWDAATGRLTIDVVVHAQPDDGSPAGVGMPWALTVEPGAVLPMTGPSGDYSPDPTADTHLLVGDESALPAIAGALETLPAGAYAVVRVVVDGPQDELALHTAAEVDLVWLHRRGEAEPELLLQRAVEAVELRGRVHAFVHGEADEIRGVRRHLLSLAPEGRGLARADMSCSPYWRRTMTDEAWRQVKRAYVAAMDADVDVPA